MSKKEKVQIKDGDIICECGNSADLSGFFPCSPDGKYLEPVRNGSWEGHYMCHQCGNVIDQDTGEIITCVGTIGVIQYDNQEDIVNILRKKKRYVNVTGYHIKILSETDGVIDLPPASYNVKDKVMVDRIVGVPLYRHTLHLNPDYDPDVLYIVPREMSTGCFIDRNDFVYVGDYYFNSNGEKIYTSLNYVKDLRR